MKTYDRLSLQSSIVFFLVSPTTTNREVIFGQILRFAHVKARAHLRPFASWWSMNGNEFIVEDLADYCILKFLTYLDSGKLVSEHWLSNPMAYLNRFFTSRAKDWVRMEKRRLARMERIDATEAGWDGVVCDLPRSEAGLIHSEVRSALFDAVDQLPSVQKTVVAGMIQGKKARQIATESGFEVSKVYESTRLAKQNLRQNRGLRELVVA